MRHASRVVVPGHATGRVVPLSEPLSFWGGFDPQTGAVSDVHHPEHGSQLDGRVVVMAGGRGSSSASSVLVEAARLGTSPAALVVLVCDEIISTGAIVAAELYGAPMPVVEVDHATFEMCAAAATITVQPDGLLVMG